MYNRRFFLGATLASALYAHAASDTAAPESAAAAIERVRSLYTSLKSFADVASVTVGVMGIKTPGEIRTAFAAPGKLCMQLAVDGKIASCQVVDGESRSSWLESKGWRTAPSLDVVLAALHGAGKAIGPYPLCLAALLLDKQLEDAVGLRALHDSRCTPSSSSCASLEGKIEEATVVVDLAKTGALENMQAHLKLGPLETTVTATAAPQLNAEIDIDALVAAARKDPAKPMRLPHG